MKDAENIYAKSHDFLDKIRDLLPQVTENPIASLEILGILAALATLIDKMQDRDRS